MKIYLASGLENIANAKLAIADLKAAGHVITYDWTEHGSVAEEAARQGTAKLLKTAHSELQGVADADVLIVLLPGGRGTHVELGAALALQKPVIIVGSGKLIGKAAADGPPNYSGTCCFYWCAGVLHRPTMAACLVTLSETAAGAFDSSYFSPITRFRTAASDVGGETSKTKIGIDSVNPSAILVADQLKGAELHDLIAAFNALKDELCSRCDAARKISETILLAIDP